MAADIHHPMGALGVVHATRGDIRVERLEDRLKPKVPFPHKHDFYQLLFITEGEGWHQIDFKKHTLQARQFYAIKPGQVHAWQLSPKVLGYVVEFTHESLPLDHLQSADLIAKVALAPDMERFKDAPMQQALHLCGAMTEEFLSEKTARVLVLQNYLSILLVHILRHQSLPIQAQNQSENMVERFKVLLEANYQTEHSVEFYSQSLGLTAKALTMRVHRLLGISAREVIQERVLLEARRLLAFSDLSIAEVGYEVGYKDANYFVRFFREHTGETPSKFRAKKR